MPNEYLLKVNSAIANIQSINLANDDAYEMIIQEIKSIGKVPRLLYNIGSGELCFRSRPNNENEYYNSINGLAYPPNSAVIKFARANIPGQSVFYCSDRRPTSYAELLEYLSNNVVVGSEIGITISVWQVISDLNVVLILNPEDCIESEFYQDHLENYNLKIAGLPLEYKEGTEKFYSFFGHKFSEIASQNSDIYKVTSAYSNLITMGNQVDGIIYPSVAFGNRGYNMALKPTVVDDQKTRLIGVAKNTFMVEEGENNLPSFRETNMKEGIINWTNNTINWTNNQ